MTADDLAHLTPPDSEPGASAVVRQGDPVVEIDVIGDLDAASMPGVLALINAEVSERTTSITLDCAGVRFCDSAGLGGLIRLTHHVPADVSLVIASPSPALVRLLEVTGSRSLFTFA